MSRSKVSRSRPEGTWDVRCADPRNAVVVDNKYYLKGYVDMPRAGWRTSIMSWESSRGQATTQKCLMHTLEVLMRLDSLTEARIEELR